jgi:hemerythrin
MMRKFELTPDLVTGVDDIDAQHRTLLDLANRVIEASEDAPPAIFHRALTFLVNYTVDHFAAEEAAMDRTAYPGARFHREFHDRLRREIAGIVAQAKQEGSSKKAQLAVQFMLEDWLIYHIRETDRDLANHLRNHSPGATILYLPAVRERKSNAATPEDVEPAIKAAVERS